MPLNNKQCFLIYFFAIFLVFGITLKNKYCIDDEYVVDGHPYVIKGIDGISDIFSNTYLDNDAYSLGYRPFTVSSYAIEYELFGSNPFVSHLINLLLYVLFICLVHLFILKIFPKLNRLYLFFAVLLFTLHPLHVEVVASLKNREEIFTGLFYLGAGFGMINFLESKGFWLWNLITIALFFVLGLITKLTILHVALFPFIFLFSKGGFQKKLIIRCSLLMVGFAALFLFFTNIKSTTIEEQAIVRHLSENPLYYINSENLKAGFRLNILLEYFRLLVFPIKLRWYYGYDMVKIVSLVSWQAILSVIINVMLIFIAFYKRKSKPIITFSILIIYCNLFLYASIIQPYAGIVSERALFLSSLGFCLLIVHYLFHFIVSTLKIDQRIPSFILIVIILLFGIQSVLRSMDWKDRETIMTRDIESQEDSAYANFMLGKTFIAKYHNGNNNLDYREKGLGYLIKAIEIDSTFSSAYYRISLVALKIDENIQEAIRYAYYAYEFEPSSVKYAYQLARNFDYDGSINEAIAMYNVTLDLDSNHYYSLYYLAQVYHMKGEVGKAFEMNDILAEKLPNADLAYLNYGSFYQYLGNEQSAVVNFEKAVKNGCEDIALLKYLLNYYLNNDYSPELIKEFQLKINELNKKL